MMKHVLAKTLGGLALSIFLTGALMAAEYTVSYEVKSDSRKNVIVKEIRMFYQAYADAIFDGVQAADGSMRFTLKDIPTTGVRVRTHRDGEKISIVTAAKNINQAKAPFEQLERDFKTKVPYYGPMVKVVDARPFLIGALSPQSFTFNRSALGTHTTVSCMVPMITPDGYGPYNDSFNVYPIMGEILRMYNHNALPSGGIAAVTSGQTKTWSSPKLNYTSILNQLLTYADHKSREYITFAQSWAFDMKYSVQENAGGVLTVVGKAAPNVEITSGVAIKTCTRTAKYRISDGVLLEDAYVIDARASNGVGWIFMSSIRMR
jgi:hypothetical protein